MSDHEKNLICCPARFLGIGIPNPVLSAFYQYNVSYTVTNFIRESIISGERLNLEAHYMQKYKGFELKNAYEEKLKNEASLQIDQFDDDRKKKLVEKI